MGYVLVRTLAGNQLYLSSAIMEHNLFRGIQIETRKPHRGTTEKRSPLLTFQEASISQTESYLSCWSADETKGETETHFER